MDAPLTRKATSVWRLPMNTSSSSTTTTTTRSSPIRKKYSASRTTIAFSSLRLVCHGSDTFATLSMIYEPTMLMNDQVARALAKNTPFSSSGPLSCAPGVWRSPFFRNKKKTRASDRSKTNSTLLNTICVDPWPCFEPHTAKLPVCRIKQNGT